MTLGVLISSLSWLICPFGRPRLRHRGDLCAGSRRNDAVGALLRIHFAARAARPAGTYMGYAFLPIAIGYFIAGPLGGYFLH